MRNRISQILLAPHVSEKSTGVAESNRQHVFRVLPSASKEEVRVAVESFFDVKVVAVNLLNVKGKRKGMGRRVGKRKDWKKAYVTLRAGDDIHLGEVS